MFFYPFQHGRRREIVDESWKRVGVFFLAALIGCSDQSDDAVVISPDTSTPSLPPEVVVPGGPPAFSTPSELGQRLFFDANLSLNRTQSCATCHDPDRAFTDPRLDDDGLPTAFSLGDDGFSRASRNAPTAAYASLAPIFEFGTHPRFNSQQPDYEGFMGGQFMDGRASTLAEQAEGPPIGPKEMGMPSKRAVVERLQENGDYIASFRAIYGEDIFDDIGAAYAAMADSIAAFESTPAFASFDSRYDKSLRDEYTYQPGTLEALGRALFFSQQFTNCATCHQLAPNGSRNETFTNYEYHNIGTPVNVAARLAANIPVDEIDPGLFGNPAVDDESELGKYKVPTLRNVAVTAPYMNNGVFRSLDTVMRFYDHFQPGSRNTINPETGSPWADPPVPETVSRVELQDGRRLSDNDIDALVCFMRSLTDERYEPLIPDDGLICD